MTDGPLIVQSDRTLLLETDHPEAAACRGAIATFAELERSPEHVHTYRVTPLALWNARAAGHDAEQVVDALLRWSRYPVPQALLVDVSETMARYGRLALEMDAVHGLVLRSTSKRPSRRLPQPVVVWSSCLAGRVRRWWALGPWRQLGRTPWYL